MHPPPWGELILRPPRALYPPLAPPRSPTTAVCSDRNKLTAAGRGAEAAAVKLQNDQNYLSDRSIEYIIRRLPMTKAVSQRV